MTGYGPWGSSPTPREVRAFGRQIIEEITELSITDDTGRTYLVLPDNVHGIMSGRRSASGGTRWIPEGEFLAVPASAEAGSGRC